MNAQFYQQKTELWENLHSRFGDDTGMVYLEQLFLKSKKFDINAHDQEGRTALSEAIECDNLDIVNLVLKHAPSQKGSKAAKSEI